MAATRHYATLLTVIRLARLSKVKNTPAHSENTEKPDKEYVKRIERRTNMER